MTPSLRDVVCSSPGPRLGRFWSIYHAVTGQLPENVRVPQYVDFEEAFDFQSSMNVIRAAEEAFNAMPAEVRDRFQNDPGRFLEFANDASNYEEALKMGLAIVTGKQIGRAHV